MATDHPDLGPPETLDGEEREALETLLFRLADDEFVIAERYTEWQVRAPTLESDLALANIAQDELGHARLWYDLLSDFGPDEATLIWERPPDEWRHATLVELPFAEGDWADVILRSYLYDVAEGIRLAALETSASPRIRDRVEKVQGEEEYHREHAERWLERLASETTGVERVQDAVDRLVPYALTVFASTDDAVEARIDNLGLRSAGLTEMRREWWDTVVPFLESLDLSVETGGGATAADASLADHLPAAIGRDRTHTDHWAELYEEFTRTYRELGRTTATRIMKDPDDA